MTTWWHKMIQDCRSLCDIVVVVVLLSVCVCAVSYTHLRAHETAIDLVCRLLLEKKFF